MRFALSFATVVCLRYWHRWHCIRPDIVRWASNWTFRYHMWKKILILCVLRNWTNRTYLKLFAVFLFFSVQINMVYNVKTFFCWVFFDFSSFGDSWDISWDNPQCFLFCKFNCGIILFLFVKDSRRFSVINQTFWLNQYVIFFVDTVHIWILCFQSWYILLLLLHVPCFCLGKSLWSGTSSIGEYRFRYQYLSRVNSSSVFILVWFAISSSSLSFMFSNKK